jgi:hypothetical protein
LWRLSSPSQVLIAEKECFTAVRHSQLEMIKLLERRAKEEQSVKLERPIYERERSVLPAPPHY